MTYYNILSGCKNLTQTLKRKFMKNNELNYEDSFFDFRENEYKSEEDAIYALYEQLFDSPYSICPETILEAMRYLIFKKQMTDQMDEIRFMRPEEVCVVHQNEIEREVEETKEEIKEQIFDILKRRN